MSDLYPIPNALHHFIWCLTIKPYCILASVVSSCSVNLLAEPEQEYIVSLRARNKAGLGSPLYETVRTGRAKGMCSMCWQSAFISSVCEPLFLYSTGTWLKQIFRVKVAWDKFLQSESRLKTKGYTLRPCCSHKYYSCFVSRIWMQRECGCVRIRAKTGVDLCSWDSMQRKWVNVKNWFLKTTTTKQMYNSL